MRIFHEISSGRQRSCRVRPYGTPVLRSRRELGSRVSEKRNSGVCYIVDNRIRLRAHHVAVGTRCSSLKIQNTDLKPGDRVQVVFTELPPQKVFLAKVAEPFECLEFDTDKTGPWPDLTGNQPELPLHNYQILFDQKDSTVGYAFGIVNVERSVEISDGIAKLIINDSSQPLYFRDCTSNEGMHMTTWSGKPLVGKRIWHVYYHFPYDTESSCKKADYK